MPGKKNVRIQLKRSKKRAPENRRRREGNKQNEVSIEPVEGQNGLFTIRLSTEDQAVVLPLSEITRILTEPLRVAEPRNAK